MTKPSAKKSKSSCETGHDFPRIHADRSQDNQDGRVAPVAVVRWDKRRQAIRQPRPSARWRSLRHQQYGGRSAAVIVGGNTIVYFLDYGTVFRITPDGTFSTLVVFDNRPLGSQPCGLVQGPDGNFYGATQWDG